MPGANDRVPTAGRPRTHTAWATNTGSATDTRSATVWAADTGSATVWAAGAILVLLTVTVFGLELAVGLVARHRTEAAADLGALAAAEHVLDGPVAACAYAARVAERMAVGLLGCRLDGHDALVETAGHVALGVPVAANVRARARAGPAPWQGCPRPGCPAGDEPREPTG